MIDRTRKTDRPRTMADSGISHIGLNVRDLRRSVDFYRNILGLDDIAGKPSVARITCGSDKIVLHEKSLGMRGYHFGFQLESFHRVDEWRAWLRTKKLEIYDDITEDSYRSFKIRDPDGHFIEIFCDRRKMTQ